MTLVLCVILQYWLFPMPVHRAMISRLLHDGRQGIRLKEGSDLRHTLVDCLFDPCLNWLKSWVSLAKTICEFRFLHHNSSIDLIFSFYEDASNTTRSLGTS